MAAKAKRKPHPAPNAKTNCADDPKAMDTIQARERDLDKIGATLNVEKPR